MPIIYRPDSDATILENAAAMQKKIDKQIIAENKSKEATNRLRTALNEKCYKAMDPKNNPYRKYAGFTETLRNGLLESAIYEVFSSAMAKVDKKLNREVANENSTIMHSLVYQFIHENGGAAPLLSKMTRHNTTYALSEIANTTNKAFKKIIEGIEDMNNPDELHVHGDDMDSFKDRIHKCDACDDVSESIADRVAAAISEFIEQNAEDKKKITTALMTTKEKIDSLDTDDEAIKENYAQMGKLKVSEIRNRPKSLFNEMVSTMAKSVMANKDLQREFVEGSNLNIHKIVDKVSLMYGFLETVNSMQLIKVDNSYVKAVLESMSN